MATINDPNYQGSATGTLVISKRTATVTLGNLTQTYTGTPRSATATTVPSGLTVTFTYNGSATAPSAGGSYTVVATISDGNYTGSATGTMTIEPLTPAVRLSSGTNPSIMQTGVTFTASVSSTVGTPTGTRKLPGRHNPAWSGDTLCGRGHADYFVSERWLPFDHCRVQRGQKLRRRQQRGIIAVGPRLQLDARFGQRWWDQAADPAASLHKPQLPEGRLLIR